MTEQCDKTNAGSAVVAEVSSAAGPAPISRRALIRGASAAVPAILTLHSGSAVAAMASAALITPTNQPQGGNYLCFSEVTADTATGKYVFRPPVFGGDVTVIPGHEAYYTQRGATASRQVSPLDMCSNVNGQSEFWYQPGGHGSWQQIQVNRGIVVSCDALGSFGAVDACSRDV
jgi:hypothetical protein